MSSSRVGNRRAASGVIGVMRRAEDRKRRQQVASASTAAYIADHRLPETLDAIIGDILLLKPEDPMELLEKLLRQRAYTFGGGVGDGRGFGVPLGATVGDAVGADGIPNTIAVPTAEAGSGGNAEETIGSPITAHNEGTMT